MTIANSPNSIINWQGFSIGTNEAVRFIQQNDLSGSYSSPVQFTETQPVKLTSKIHLPPAQAQKL